MYTRSNELRDAPLREKMLQYLEALLVKNNVALDFWGHVHRHERFCPLNNFTCGSEGQKGENGTVHVVVGMAGQDWQPIWEPRPDHPDVSIFPQPIQSLYRAGEFGYTRLVATKKKLVLSYIGNHDGKVHDMVEISASGEIVNGNGDAGIADANTGGENKDESTLSWYVEGASVLVLGAFLDYILRFISHARKKSDARNVWTPVKTEET